MFDFGIEYVSVSYCESGRSVYVGFRDGGFLISSNSHLPEVVFIHGRIPGGQAQVYPVA